MLDIHPSIAHNHLNTLAGSWEGVVAQPGTPDEKRRALREAHALNPRPQAVVDALFTAGQGFFDARDLVQVKYEMLRRVHLDGYSVTQAAAAFGLSRPTFYQAQRAWQRAGLAGLVPSRPGPRRAHKLGTEVVRFLQEARAADPHSRATHLARQVAERFGVVVHPRSIERALARSGDLPVDPPRRPAPPGRMHRT
jgi:transposase